MRIVREVIIGDTRVTCRELTLAEVRGWLTNLGEAPPDLVADGLFDGLTLAELRQMCDLDAALAEGLAPSEIQRVVDACKECNPHFFGFRARLVERGRALSGASTMPPAPSSAPATPPSGPTPTASS